MDSVLRGAAIYVVLLLIVRATGKRTLAQVTTFDFILLLVVAEATQQGLLGDDFSVTNALLVITTLVLLDRLLDLAGARSPGLGKVLNDVPLIIVQDGEVVAEHLKRTQISLSDILQEARMSQGLERLEQIKYAVLERNGGISIIPKASG